MHFTSYLNFYNGKGEKKTVAAQRTTHVSEQEQFSSNLT